VLDGRVDGLDGIPLNGGEIHQLEWPDVEVDGSSLPHPKREDQDGSAVGRDPGMAYGRDHRDDAARRSDTREARLRGLPPDVAKNVMARACKAAGIAHYHPHDLQHRYASVKIHEGVPVTQVAAQLGHARKSLTLDIYSHVLLDEPR
jgi:integrase